MSHGPKVLRRTRVAPECRTRTSKSSSTSADWWDDIFEAADLVKFTRHTLPCLGDGNKTGGGEEGSHDHSKIEAGWGDNAASSGIGAGPCYSSTSSASQNQQDCSEKQSDCGGDTSQLLYPSRLKIHAAKIALNSGKEHLSISGQVRRARRLKNPCHLNCKRCQHPRLTAAERQVVLDHFWSLKSHEKQWKFISNAVSVSTPKRKFAVQGSKGEKSCSREYFFAINGRKRKVCKTMFKHTLSICDSWINSALSHDPIGLPDLRGKRNKRVSRS